MMTASNNSIEARRRNATALSLAFALVFFAFHSAQYCHAESTNRDFDASAVLEQAQTEFDRGVAVQSPDSAEARRLFRNSLAGFEKLIDNDVENAGLFFNAGNAALRSGSLGKAIAYYRRALAYDPAAEDIRHNLEQARSRRSMQIAEPPSRMILDTIVDYHQWIAPRVWKYIAIAGWILFWALFALYLLRKRTKLSVPGWSSVLAIIVFAVSGNAYMTAAQNVTSPSAGVVMKDETVLRKGNGDGYQPRIEQRLVEGIEFDLIEKRPDPASNQWLRVRLQDGTDGWIRADRAMLLDSKANS